MRALTLSGVALGLGSLGLVALSGEGVLIRVGDAWR